MCLTSKKEVAIKLLVALICIVAIEATVTEYSREFQLRINFDEFQNGREEGINRYFEYFAEVAGVNLDSTFPIYTKSVREEISIKADKCADRKGGFSLRDYQWGDLMGQKITQVKTRGALRSSADALAEPFEVSSTYSPYTIFYIEYDIHACEADWSATSRIFETSFPKLETCADLHDVFPDAVKSSSASISLDGGVYVYSAFRNGTYLGGDLTLDVVLNYNSLDNAINDVNLRGGEFSFTMYAANQNDGEWSADQDRMAITIYESMLAEFGSPSDGYPCDPPVDIADLVLNDNNNDDDGDNDQNNSSDSILLLPSILLIFLVLFI